ncbi:hypothetical protein ASPWEDRAFT_150448 [Aspergillus wentii DTO 134E9]|uniref:Small ribosomal subunit protein mS38 n=1 Tax=Aspergillus wentii DTO 134E9 TaxID=1073089 RepID=A0A1L9RWQ3_ASPWE|nr:uncharacterized protein ASPWEDRAFT_150448 [Aspergillus wentii DTO 134E9]KAI9928943.1 hypothetical protein MW887_001336 [Aspergillus wentii]OJJ39371.1 hypothetical protein ASPWEDRAFT_150448 [Aspergillus wentii DTO 134E9]
MLSSSLRRAAWAPIVPISGVSRQPTQGFAAAAAASSSSSGLLGATNQNVRQRRYSSSSSKPSDGSRIDASSQTPAKGVNSGEKREGKASRRRGKDGNARQKSSQQSAFSNLPSVPSTQHRQPHDVHVASFFSIHRPISVSTTVPPTSSAETFDSIFSKRSTKNEADDVIFTLSSAVDTMEGSAQNMEQDESNILTRGSNFEMDGAHLDGINLGDLKISVDELTKRLRPFHPPPPPVPFDEAKDAHQAIEPEGTSYSTVLTIHESTHADGRKTYEAHTTPFVRSQDMDAPGVMENEAIEELPTNSGATYIERLRNNRTMHAISTKRRRKSKMKKHKFKKLLRKTRTLRRKLDKA